jgi:hypothetical protein
VNLEKRKGTVFIEELIIAELMNKFSAVYGTRRFIIMWDFRFSLRRGWRWKNVRITYSLLSSKKIDVSKMHSASVFALMMEAVRTSEMFVYFNETTRCCISEGYRLHSLLCSRYDVNEPYPDAVVTSPQSVPLLLLLPLFMSMGWDCVSEMWSPTGPLFVLQVIYEYGKPQWNDIETG